MKGQLTYYKKELLTKPLLFAYAIIFLYSFVNQLLVTPLTSYGLYFGISGTVMGVITNAYEFSCMAARNPAGYLVDRGR